MHTPELSGNAQGLLDSILASPLHQAVGLRVRAAAGGQSRLRFQVNEFCLNITGHLHGGITYAMVDVACFLALASRLEPGRHGVTVDMQVSVLRPAGRGDQIIVKGRLDRLGRQIAHMRAEVFVDSAEGEKLIATGSVTKSVIEVQMRSVG